MGTTHVVTPPPGKQKHVDSAYSIQDWTCQPEAVHVWERITTSTEVEIGRSAAPLSGKDGAYEQNTSQALSYLVACVLLMSDQSQGEPSHTDGQIAEVLDISRRTVIRIKQRFVQESLGVALAGSFPRERPERRCLDGEGEHS